jgi:hypothetical protein
MKIIFFDRQDPSNPVNGTAISDANLLESVLNGLRNREPFFCEIEGENGYKLTVGLADDIGCVQHRRNDGSPPYLVTVAPDQEKSNAETILSFSLEIQPRQSRGETAFPCIF